MTFFSLQAFYWKVEVRESFHDRQRVEGLKKAFGHARLFILFAGMNGFDFSRKAF